MLAVPAGAGGSLLRVELPHVSGPPGSVLRIAIRKAGNASPLAEGAFAVPRHRVILLATRPLFPSVPSPWSPGASTRSFSPPGAEPSRSTPPSSSARTGTRSCPAVSTASTEASTTVASSRCEDPTTQTRGSGPRGGRGGRCRRPLEPSVALGGSPPPVELPIHEGLVPGPLRRKARLRARAAEPVPGADPARPPLRLDAAGALAWGRQPSLPVEGARPARGRGGLLRLRPRPGLGLHSRGLPARGRPRCDSPRVAPRRRRPPDAPAGGRGARRPHAPARSPRARRRRRGPERRALACLAAQPVACCCGRRMDRAPRPPRPRGPPVHRRGARPPPLGGLRFFATRRSAPVGLALVASRLASGRSLRARRDPLALAALLPASAALAWRNRASLFDLVRRERRTLLVTEILFHALFALGLLLRFANPDLWIPRSVARSRWPSLSSTPFSGRRSSRRSTPGLRAAR